MCIESCIKPDWGIPDLLAEPWEMVIGDEWYHTLLKIALTAAVIIGSLFLALIPMFMILSRESGDTSDNYISDNESIDSEFMDIGKAGRMSQGEGTITSPSCFLSKIPTYLFTTLSEQAFWDDVLESSLNPELESQLKDACGDCESGEELKACLLNLLDVSSIESISLSNLQSEGIGNVVLHRDILHFTSLRQIQFINCGTLFESEEFEEILLQIKTLETITIFNQDEYEMRMYPERLPPETDSLPDEDVESKETVIDPATLKRLASALQPIPDHYYNKNGWFVEGSPPTSVDEAEMNPPDFVAKIPPFLKDLPNLKSVHLIGFDKETEIPEPLRAIVSFEETFFSDIGL